MKLFDIKMLRWPENLLRTIFVGKEYDVMMFISTPEFESTLTHVLMVSLSDQEADVIYSFYRDGISLRSIADRYDMNLGWCRQVRDRALRKLRHPARSKHLRGGLVKVVMPMQ